MVRETRPTAPVFTFEQLKSRSFKILQDQGGRTTEELLRHLSPFADARPLFSAHGNRKDAVPVTRTALAVALSDDGRIASDAAGRWHILP